MYLAAFVLACLGYAGRARRMQAVSPRIQGGDEHADSTASSREDVLRNVLSYPLVGSHKALASALLAISNGRGLPMQVGGAVHPVSPSQFSQTRLPVAKDASRDALHRISPHPVESLLTGSVSDAFNTSSSFAWAEKKSIRGNPKSFRDPFEFGRAVLGEVCERVDIEFLAMYVGVALVSICVVVSSYAKQLWGRGSSVEDGASSNSRLRMGHASIRRAGVPVASIADETANENVKQSMSEREDVNVAAPLLASVFAAAVFACGLYKLVSPDAGYEFAAGYVVEQSLSIDNIFVFMLIFKYFKVPQELEAVILSWGIFGAVVMRGLFIAAGAVLIESFNEVLLVFAAVLLYSSYKLLVLEEEEDEDLENNAIVSFVRSYVPAVSKYDGNKFLSSTDDGRTAATPLLITLICIELSDIVFAVDSVPAVFGVTEDPLIVFSSNIFAILALRSLYSVLSVAVKEMQYLEQAVAIVLGFVGAKLVGEYFGFQLAASTSVAIILSILIGGVGLSLYRKDTDT
mmetsp:Transcript_87141/g.136365  ORF Transcript_87141/g.136365 Transcript_87141/m.136365 type:complete len:517 (-) Transcript_87141:131-1681(-)